MIYERISDAQMKILKTVIPILMLYLHVPFKNTDKMYFVAPIRPAAASCIKPLASCIYSLSTNEKRRNVMTSGFRKYMAGYTVANLLRYPIRCRVAFASALECIFICWHL